MTLLKWKPASDITIYRRQRAINELFIADERDNNAINKKHRRTLVSTPPTYAGNGIWEDLKQLWGYYVSAVGWVVSTFAGNGDSTRFNSPFGVAVDSSGNVYVSDYLNHRIRKITSGGVVSTLAGTGDSGYQDGAAASARFSYPSGIAVDSDGNVYVADNGTSRIRKITASTGIVSTLAGDGTDGDVDGAANSAKFYSPYGLALDSSGNVYVADYNNHKIRKIDVSTDIVSTLAGTGDSGFQDGAVAKFSFPSGIAVDSSGNVYVTDNERIRKITSAGVVSTFAGTGAGGYLDGAADSSKFNNPSSLAVDSSENVYVTDNESIRKITSTGIVSTLAGSGPYSGYQDGAAASSKFSGPNGVAVDSFGNLYVADSVNNRIRKITYQ